MKIQLTPIPALCIYLIILATYSYCIWQTARAYHPIQQQIIINDLNKRLDNSQWQLLSRNAEIGNLNRRIDSLTISKFEK